MSSVRILIVEDEPDLLVALSRAFRSAGYEVHSARDGEEALAQIAEEVPHIVLSDVIMPGTNGFQLTRQLKAKELTRQIPVLLMSAKVEAADTYWAEEVGAIELLRKPLELRELLAKVEQVVEQGASAEHEVSSS